MLQKEVIEFVIPVYNETKCIPLLMDRLFSVRDGNPDLDIRFLFVDDGSSDGSFNALATYADHHTFVRLVGLSRNFGHQAAVTAGLAHARGDYVCIIDADLQDPPELVRGMFDIAKSEGADVVYGQRSNRKGETAFKRLTASLFYRMLRSLCEVDLPLDTGDFRLVSRRVVAALNDMPERHRFIRGMVPWLGFKALPIAYERDERAAGETKYPLSKMFKLAADAVFSFSIKPLRIASYFGLIICLITVLGLGYIIGLKLFTTQVVPGITIILTSVIFIGGVQLIILGALGEYIGRIFEQTKMRPLYVVRSTRNFDPNDSGAATHND